MWYVIVFLAGFVVGGTVLFFVGKKHGERIVRGAGTLKDTVGKF
jgi:membrane protein DedA with SNARE-associated domain